jgi:two-component system, OmpR family, alkaline phosphatase synthesis response regulator PhoP
MQKRILIVEDDQALARVIKHNLTFEGFEVALVTDGHAAVGRARAFTPDLILLDLMLPGCNGLDLCAVLHEGGNVPIIIVSARGQKVDKLKGLDLGADDYLTKPFDMDELLARIRAVLRRTRSSVDHLTLGRVTIDFGALRATIGNAEIHLTHREFEVLRYLAERQERVVHRDELLREIWGYLDAPETTRSVDHAIARLRKKIEENPPHPRFIHTVHGGGYCLTVTGELDDDKYRTPLMSSVPKSEATSGENGER